MDLTLSPVQVELAEAARAAFAAGKPAPIIEGALTDLAVVAVELGRAAVPSTFHTDVLARLLGWQGAGSVAVAVEAVRGVRLGGLGLDAVADLVAHAAEAEALLLRIDDDQVAEVHLGAAGIAVRAQPTIGDDSCCQLSLANAPILAIYPCDVVGATARAAVVLAADAVGAARAALEAAVGHVTSRHQWGAPLGTLQAVQHRCADMLIDVTLAADAVFDAAAIADRGEAEIEVRLAAAYAKATAIERCRRVTASAQQLAGGQGIYADHPFHRWYRRVKAAEPRLGDARRHRALIAATVVDMSPRDQA